MSLCRLQALGMRTRTPRNSSLSCAGTGGFPGVQQSTPVISFGAQPTAVGGGLAAAPNPAPFTGFAFNPAASAPAFGGGQAQPFSNATSAPAFGNQAQPAVSSFSGFGQQPGSAAASAPSTFGGGSAPVFGGGSVPAANGSFQFGSVASPQSAPGMLFLNPVRSSVQLLYQMKMAWLHSCAEARAPWSSTSIGLVTFSHDQVPTSSERILLMTWQNRCLGDVLATTTMSACIKC